MFTVAFFGNNSPITELSIASIQGQYARCTADVYFFMILSGEVEFHCGEHITHATLHDVVMFPAGQAFTAHAAGNNLNLIIAMHGDFFAQGQSELLGHFVCSSPTDRDRDYSAVRKLLSQLALIRIKHTELRELRENELAYSLVYYLNRYHYVSSPSVPSGKTVQRYAERTAQIHSYIEHNYRHSVSLADLAERTYLTPAYLSRFIHQQLGKSFTEMVSDVRLRHAASELLQTDQAITTIAYNNGFSSPSSFNRQFREAYALPPHAYRRQNRPVLPAQSSVVEPRDYTLAEHTLSGFAAYGEASVNAIRLPGQEVCRVEDVGSSTPIVPLWNTLINIGYSSYLNNSSLQAQLAMAQKEIGFRYGRIQSVLNDELLPPLPSGDSYNFSGFDRFIEWMLSINLTPFLDLTYQQNYLMLGGTSIIYPAAERAAGSAAGTKRQFYAKVSALIIHCINTFGVAEVERWGFEIGYMHSEYLVLAETPAAFVQRFSTAYHIIKQLLPGANIGGIHHNASIAPEVFEQIIQEMDRIDFSPDFVSLCCFPYERATDDAYPQLYVYSTDPACARHKVAAAKAILAQYPSITQRLYLTVFGTDVKTRNPLNDSCFQSTFLVKNTIDLMGMVELVGYWQLSDIATESADAARILFGGTGILSMHGLKKPGFTALKRMNYLHDRLVKKGDGYLVATNTRNAYDVLIYNYAHYSDIFCFSDPSTLPLEEVYSSFSDPYTKDITIELCHMPAGRYKIITTTLNRENGSLLDEWIRYGILDDLQPRDIHYLRDVVHPQRLACYQDCSDGMLTLHAQLLPHEVKFYEIIREL